MSVSVEEANTLGPSQVQYRDLTFSALETVDLLNQNIADTAGTVHYFQVIHGRLQITVLHIILSQG